jgi:hypothetical protein
MPRYNIEWSGRIVAASIQDAADLAEHIAECAVAAHRYRIADGPDAACARIEVESTSEEREVA